VGEVIVAALLVAAAVLVGLILYFNNREEEEDQPETFDGKGNWYIAERNAGPNSTTVCIVRRYKDRDINVIRVATIRDDAADWTTKYEEAMAAARDRLASLRAEN